MDLKQALREDSENENESKALKKILRLLPNSRKPQRRQDWLAKVRIIQNTTANLCHI